MHTKLARKIIIFCFVGGVSTLIDMAILIALVEFMRAPVLLAATIGVAAASINGYILNRRLTFKDSSPKVAKQYVSYLLVSLVGVALTLLSMHLLIRYLGLYYVTAKIITVVLVTSWNFTINHLFVFKTAESA